MRRGRFIITCLAALLALALIPAWAGAAPASLVDGDFSGGTPDANTEVIANDFVTLVPTVTFAEDFPGTTLPTGWTSTPWPSGGAATVSGGALRVDGALAAAPGTYNAGQSLAFTATFGDAQFQHVGFGTDFDQNPNWAMFSTFNTGGANQPLTLYARTSVSGTANNVALPSIDPLIAHEYEIQWTAAEVNFYVDGNLVSTQTITIPNGQRVLASDFTANGPALTVEDLSLAPYPTQYPASGTFTSRVLDGGDKVGAWGALTAEGFLLETVGYQTRSGNTPAPDATWSDWQSLGAAGAVQSPARRYIQYRAILAPNGGSSPVLDRVTIAYTTDTTGPSVGISGVSVSGSTATVSFSSPDADVARFECRLDGGAFAACASPKIYAGLAPGNHTVTVRAFDRLGNLGPEASRGFSVAAPPPPDHSGPVVKPSPRSVRASRSGRVTFRVRCPKTEQRCKITLQLKRGRKAVSSKKTVRLLGGKRAKLTVRLTKGYRAYLSTHTRLKVKAVTVAYDAANNRKTTRVKVTVRAPKR